jgi:hypothetical protein
MRKADAMSGPCRPTSTLLRANVSTCDVNGASVDSVTVRASKPCSPATCRSVSCASSQLTSWKGGRQRRGRGEAPADTLVSHVTTQHGSALRSGQQARLVMYPAAAGPRPRRTHQWVVLVMQQQGDDAGLRKGGRLAGDPGSRGRKPNALVRPPPVAGGGWGAGSRLAEAAHDELYQPEVGVLPILDAQDRISFPMLRRRVDWP